MNNNPTNNYPNVPPAHADWRFYTTLLNCTQDFGRTDNCRSSHRLARRTLLKQLHLMAATECAACSGPAHRARDCPVNLRLGMLSASNAEWAKLIAWTRTRT